MMINGGCDKGEGQLPSSSPPPTKGEEEDRFKQSFKKFRKYQYPHHHNNHKDLILLDPTSGPDPDSQQHHEVLMKERVIINLDKSCSCRRRLGLKNPEEWKVHELTFPQGLILISNPFTSAGQRYWIRRAVIDFPKEQGHITNLIKGDKKDKDELEFYRKLRWVTFGYHHNWDTKVYSESNKSPFPPDLGELTKYISQALGFDQPFEAEAAIVNYYHLDSTLSGHVDKSEVNEEAPLFSLSFGQPCVFLIGGPTKDIKPQAVLLRSGDVVVMTGQSRKGYHAVPKVFKEEYGDGIHSNSPTSPWGCGDDTDNQNEDLEEEREKNKRMKLDNDDFSSSWTPFLSTYVSKSRINLNIRQVLYPGDHSLEQSLIRKTKLMENNKINDNR